MSSVIEEAVSFRDFAASYRIEKPVKREDFKWKNQYWPMKRLKDSDMRS